MRVFYDTNVLLDVLLRQEPFFEDSARTWTLAERGHLEGCVSALSFAVIFYIVGRRIGREAARDAIQEMHGIFAPATCDARVIDQAVHADLPDFEDAIQYFSALRTDADCILSRDPGDFPRRPVLPVLSPTEFLARLEAE